MLLVFYEQGRRLKKVVVKKKKGESDSRRGNRQRSAVLLKIKCILMANDKSAHIKRRSAG